MKTYALFRGFTTSWPNEARDHLGHACMSHVVLDAISGMRAGVAVLCAAFLADASAMDRYVAGHGGFCGNDELARPEERQFGGCAKVASSI